MFWIILVVALFLLSFLAVVAYLILNEGKKYHKTSHSKPQTQIKNKKFSTDLDKMIESAKNTRLDNNELKELIKLFVQTHKLGSKTSKQLDEKTKHKLEFIAALASNVNASVENISFLNKELKKISNSYKKEIDAYEQMGLARRKMKS